jgi:hypothetical protein
MPDEDYLRFRLETQYGAAPAEARDVVAYLEWCRAMDRAVGRGSAKADRRRRGRR